MSDWLQSEAVKRALVSVGILVVAAILAALARVIFGPILRKLTARTQTELDDLVVRALNRPIAWAILLIGVYAALLRFRVWKPDQITTIQNAGVAAAIVLVVYAALRVFNTAAGWYTETAAAKSARPREIRAQAVVASKVLNILILLCGILIILRQYNVAVALALQDTLTNLFAGIYMMVDQPITVGDFVKLESGEEGFVEEVGWRNTKVRMWANNIVVIPNSKLAQSVVTNYYLPRQEMSVYIRCGVAYDSDLEHVERVCIEVGKEIMERMSGTATDWTPVVRFKEFADFSINFVVVLRVRDFAAQYALAHEYMKALHRRFAEEGIEIPFPIRTVIMKPAEESAERRALEADAAPRGTSRLGEGEAMDGVGEDG